MQLTSLTKLNRLRSILNWFRTRSPSLARRRPIQDEQGQSLAFIAMAMVLLVGMFGLVVDYGYATVIHRQMQVAADLAALAGARELALDQTNDVVVGRIQQVLTQNGADAELSTYTITDGERVAVTARQKVDTFFASALGIDSYEVASSAQALMGVAASSLGLMPIAVEEDAWVPGQTVSLWGESNGAGNFGWVRWTGQSLGVSTLRANIDHPEFSDALSVGDWVNGSPGVSFRAVQPNLNRWIGKTIAVFLYNPDEVTGQGANLKYRVVGFAQFQLSSTTAHGSSSEIIGAFVDYIELGGDLEPIGSPGTRTVTLIQ